MDKSEIMRKVAAGEISPEEGEKLIDAANDRPRGTLYLKVSPKGGVSLYGLQRMPVTLYVEQWGRLLDFSNDIRKFLDDHAAELKRKA